MSLTLDNVSLSRSKRQLLKGVNVQFAPGQVTVIVGPNGAGKTSLLRCVTGEWPVTAGQVLLQQQLLSQWPLQARAQIMAVLPQSSSLEFPFTALEVVLLGRTPHATSHADNLRIAQKALAWVDGAGLAQRLYLQLSGGEKQRVQLARVVCQIWQQQQDQQRYLLLDEPSAAFDLAHQQLLLNLVGQLAQQQVSVVMVMHDLNLAAACADQLLMLHKGEVAAKGSVHQVLTVPLIKTVFNVDVHIGQHPQTGKPLVINN